MDYRYLGRSALKVSPLCLGAMMFGGETDEATSARIIDKAFSRGINFIDTADVYHAGRSEEVVGRAIASRRDSWVVATKFGYPAGPDAEPNRQGQSRKWIVESVDAEPEAARHRLHRHPLFPSRADRCAARRRHARDRRPDPARQGALLRAVELQGLAHRRDRAARGPARHRSPGRERTAVQPRRSHGRGRTASAAVHYGIGVVPYSPLARGVLTGKYAVDAQPPADSRAGRGDRRISKRNGAPNRCTSRSRWPRMPPRAARRQLRSRSHGS